MMIAKENKILYSMMLIYAFFAFLTPLSSTIFVVLCVLMAVAPLLLDDSNLLCFFVFSSCFMACGGLTALFLTLLDVALAIFIIKKLVIAIKSNNKKHIKFICAMFILTLVLLMYGLIMTKFHFYKLGQGIGLILTIISIYLLDKIDIKKITLTLSAGLIISSTLSLMGYAGGMYNLAPFIKDSSSLIRFGAYFNNVNALAMYCSLCQACLLTLFLIKKLELKKWIWLLIIITLIGLSTFSKTFMLITVATYGLAILLGFIQSKNKKQYIKFGIIALVIVAAVCLIGHNYIEMIIKRFYADKSYGGSALNIITTGRVDIWTAYIDKWISSPLYMMFGCGITANNINEKTTHSLLLSIIYKFGIVGTLVLIGILVFIFKSRKASRCLANYLPLLIVLINGISEDITCSLYTCLPILLAGCFMLMRKEFSDNKE